jgi:GT2 family glycosyltransferase
MSSVAVVILNYNGKHFLEKFLPNVIACSKPHQIWIADNASTDGSVDWLKTTHAADDIKILELPTNTGYAGGYNRALAQIEADYYVLLNSDVEVTPHWITPLLHTLETTGAVACQPKILAFDRKTHFEHAGAAGGYIDWLGYPFCRGRLFDECEPDTGQYNDSQPVFWATGACLVIKSSVFWQIGGFDDTFFAHMEEIDLCWRLYNQNLSVYYCATSVVYHVGGGTLPSSSPFKTYLNYRNGLAMMFKNLPTNQLLPVIFLRLVLDGISAIRFLPTFDFKNIWAIIRAHFAFYSMIPQLSKKRGISPKLATHATSTFLIYPKSIVWQYFIRHKHTFKELLR